MLPPMKFPLALIFILVANVVIVLTIETKLTADSKQYGIIVCSGEGDMFLETITMIEHTRYKSESKLPITVAHCSELSAQSERILRSIDNVEIINLCSPNYDMFKSIHSRLKGFFCKPAALLASPYQNTILADTDVVWFIKPELLFDSPLYTSTGTLFFRDRWTQTKNRLTLTKATHHADHLYKFLKMNSAIVSSHFDTDIKTPTRELRGNVTRGSSHRSLRTGTDGGIAKRISTSNANAPSNRMRVGVKQSKHVNREHQYADSSMPQQGTKHANRFTDGNTDKTSGFNFRPGSLLGDLNALAESNAFWRHFALKKEFTPDHWQDSSVVLLNIARHPRTVFLLQKWLADFSIGYGDKEMYWLAATAAGEPFAFEPHIAGSLGDCGALVHFDPRVDDRNVSLAANNTQQSNSNFVGENSSSSSSSSSSRDKISLVPNPASLNTLFSSTAKSPDAGGSSSSSQAKPFYINAEYLIDTKKVTKAGQFLQSPHNLLTSPQVMEEASTPLYTLNPWKKNEHGFYPCGACHFSPCAAAEESSNVINEIRDRQRFILALKAARAAAPDQSLTLEVYTAVKKKLASDTKY